MRLLLLIAFCALVGCTVSSTTPGDDRQGPGDVKKQDDPAQKKRLLEIAAKYKSLEKVDATMRFAPVPCAPAGRVEDNLKPDYRVSRSDDEGTHGRKLYSLYAAKVDLFSRNYYEETLAGKKQPLTDQVVVKESWLAVETKPNEKHADIAIAVNGKHYRNGEKGPLFVMFQTDSKDPNSDEGWVYGTLTPDGKTVTGVGRLENCMGCHQKAPHGRLFGLPKD